MTKRRVLCEVKANVLSVIYTKFGLKTVYTILITFGKVTIYEFLFFHQQYFNKSKFQLQLFWAAILPPPTSTHTNSPSQTPTFKILYTRKYTNSPNKE